MNDTTIILLSLAAQVTLLILHSFYLSRIVLEEIKEAKTEIIKAIKERNDQ